MSKKSLQIQHINDKMLAFLHGRKDAHKLKPFKNFILSNN